MPLKGKDGGAWKDASAVYGKSGDTWLYAKYAMAKKDGEWERAWTDCRLYDAGGRDWSSPSTVITYTGTCGNRTQTTTVTRTKEGCPPDVRATTVSSPDCNSGCFNASTVTEEYFDGSCTTRRLRTKTVTNPKPGSNCDSTTTYGSPYASPTCEGGCTTAKTGNFTQGGVEYYYTGPAGYYEAFIAGETGNPGGCGYLCPPGFFNYGYYYIETCGGTNYIQTLYCIGCQSYFG